MITGILQTASKSVLVRSRCNVIAKAATTTRLLPSCRMMATGSEKKESPEDMPFGIGKMLGLGGEPDNLIPTDKDRKLKEGYMPEFLPDDIKKDMKELGLDSIEDLDELEEKNLDGYNDLGLVPPVGTGTYASPILIPSRRVSRVVGYVEPASHSLRWFTIYNDENTYYIPDIGLFFKMLHIPDEEAAAAHH